MSIQKKPKRQKHYLNNKALYEEMKIYKAAVNRGEDPPISNYIGQCILSIAEGLASKSNFAGYSYREEMIGDGIENCFMYIKNFNTDKYSNPFAYFTQIIKFSFIRRIQKEKRQQYIKIKNVQNHFMFEELVNDTQHREMYENNNRFVEEFEAKLNEKKKKAAK